MGKRSRPQILFRCLLTKYLFPRGYAAQRRIRAIRSCEMRPHICKPMPDAAKRRRALEGIRGEFARGQKQFGNRLPYSAGTASAFLNYPQRPFYLRASPALPATPVIFSARPAREVNFVRFAMLKNIVGFVVIRQNALIPPLPAPLRGAGSGGNVQDRRFIL